MTIKRIIKDALKNGGITLNNKYNKYYNNYGYVVSIADYEKTFTLKQLKQLKKALKQYKKIVKNTSYLIGLWIDENIIYLDVNNIYYDIMLAVEKARANNQKAIFDNKNNISIYL